MIKHSVRKGHDGLYHFVELSGADQERERGYAASETERARSDDFVKRWKNGGGAQGELTRREGRPTAAVGHMPFPGSRHMGEK